MLELELIRIDGGTQTRVELDQDTVDAYAESYLAGAEFPPVTVFFDGKDRWLADGFHRYFAAKKAGKAAIFEHIVPGTKRDAVLFSLGANGKHGKPPSNADKRNAVERMLEDKEWSSWSQERIAKTCNVSIGLVSKMVHELASLHGEEIKPATRTVERNGKTYELNTANIGKPIKKTWDGVDRTHKPESIDAVPAPVVEPDIEAPPEYTELDAAHDQINELQAALAVATMGDVSEEDKSYAATLIAELRAENTSLRATLAAVTLARDTLMAERAQMVRQMKSQRNQIEKLSQK